MCWPKRRRRDAGAAQFRLRSHYAEDMAACRIGLHAEQEVRRSEIEEAQRVRLHHLGQVQHAA